MSDKVRLGIIRLGAQGSMYAKFIADGMVPNMNIGGFSDHDPAKAESVGALYPGAPFYADYLAMLDSGDVDAVVTCVPHYLHPEMGIAALQRGGPRLGREAGRCVHQAGQGAQRIRRD
jgi:predicted dehydrogenase